jgi:GTP cyclohydrolase II
VFTLHGYREKVGGQEHVAMVMGEPDGDTDVLVRVHSSA